MHTRLITKGLGLSKLLNHHIFSFGVQSAFTHSRHFKQLNANIYQNSFYRFSTDKNNKQNPQPKTSQQPKPDTIKYTINQSGSKQMEATQQQKLFNMALGLDQKYSFRNQLIISQQTYKKKTKDLRQAILFEDLLKKQLDILIYDTNGKPYIHHTLRIMLMLISAFGTIYLLSDLIKKSDKLRIYIQKTAAGRNFVFAVKVLCGLLCFVTLIKHLRMTKRYVEKIVYNTQDQHFTFTRRRVYGAKYEQKVSRFKILYTQNQALNRRGTNYLNIQNYKQYKIGYQFAWKKQDLFSHLISQRIGK